MEEEEEKKERDRGGVALWWRRWRWGGADTIQQVRTRFMAPPTCSECGSGEPLPPGEITWHRISREEEQRWWRR